MFCTQCGNQIPDGFFFCTNCGARVRQAEAPEPAAGQGEAASPLTAGIEQASPFAEPVAEVAQNVAPAFSAVEEPAPAAWQAAPAAVEEAAPAAWQAAPAAAEQAIPAAAQTVPRHSMPDQGPAHAYEPANSTWAEWNGAPAQVPESQGSPVPPQYAQAAPAAAAAYDPAYAQPEQDRHYQNYVRQVSGEQPAKEFDMPQKKSKAPVIAAIVAVLAIAGVLVAGFMTNWFGLAPGASGGSSSSASASSYTPVVTVQKTVNEYSWDDLSKISAEISKADSMDAAIEIAKVYNLTNPEGMLDGTQTKDITLADGTKLKAMIVGLYHDDKADGSGKAGITFLFNSAVAERAFNSDATNSGGWKSSAIRKWLNETFLESLPSDLKGVIASVTKNTNNVGQTQDAKSVTATTDKLWLPAFAEIAALRSADSYKEGQQYRAAVYNAEGTRYQLFSDMKDSSADFLTMKLTGNGTTDACSWWNRTPLPGNKTQFIMTSNKGAAGNVSNANNSQGVVPGFCI